MKTLAPSTGLVTLKQEMDRLFDRFWNIEWPELPSFCEWTPRLDLSETKDAVIARLEVHGIKPDEIQLSLQDQVLTIRGEKKREEEQKDEHFYRMERSYGSFARSVRLPVMVDGSKVNATFKNGLLTITLPKTPAARGASIPIEIG